MLEPHYTVVGAGIAGLAAAVMLARAGRAVRVLEASHACGGLATSHRFRGIDCDLGSHRLHAASLGHPLFREMAAPLEFRLRPRRGVLLLGGRRIPYPPSVPGLLLGLGAGRTASFALSLARARGARRWELERSTLPGGDDPGFEAFVKQRAGRAAYETFYRPYVEKVWGLRASELSQILAKSRLSTERPTSALAALARDGQRKFVYPEWGIGALARWLEEELARFGGRVEYEARWRPGGHGDGTVLYSGHLADLVRAPLEHRGLYLVYVALPVDRAGDHETYYAPEARYWFGRVSELRHYSPRLSRAGETILVVEIPEGRWGSTRRFDQAPLAGELLAQLRDASLLREGQTPLAVEQRFVPGVYPVYRRGWLGSWRSAMSDVAALGNVLPFGRQGLFLHCNIHHAVELADALVTHVLGGGDAAGWIATAERFLSLRVAD